MLVQKQYDDILPTPYGGNECPVMDEDMIETEIGTLEINGIGKLQIVNTGGTSASEGGMGSGSEGGKEKGDLQHPMTGEKGGKSNDDNSDTSFDPIGKNIKEKEKEQDKE